ncbi:SDR family oxidoreductase [Metabacillus iocasae]|uniref:NAD(P)-dependent dehydrogenase (Short-subunit alcohol dehydrogenase family) n=1 Tax=Priestia iocasae TaxID=2291674 RepID=A0ABS2QU55_9BACI|nr:SDR family oxidoreductase [Metabacillus iocasae]MBM7703015.1 NAD(P)-dependent dehydrogenase (short-subunit alcohol dehydrogenase family) [Metabacillus iocasae]
MKSSYRNLFSLKNKTVIVTGALGFLGRECVKGLAEHGANVAIVDLIEEDAVIFAEEVSRVYNVKTVGVACDVSVEADVSKMVEKVVETLGNVDVLFNNAASKSNDLDAFFAPFQEYSLDEWKKIMAVNLDGMFLVAKHVSKQMIHQQTGGSIIQTSSIYGIVGPDHRIYKGSLFLDREINSPAVYSASKAGVVGLTTYLSTYLAKHRIRVNTLTPGGIQTGQNQQFIDNYSNRVPLGRMANINEVVGAVIFMASEASSYMTGQNMIIDGGLTAW